MITGLRKVFQQKRFLEEAQLSTGIKMMKIFQKTFFPDIIVVKENELHIETLQYLWVRHLM